MTRGPRDQGRRCTATARSGNPCQNPAIRGAVVCYHHGGKAPQVRARAAQRAAIASFSLRQDIDPLSALLDEVERTAGRIAWVESALAEQAAATSPSDMVADSKSRDLIAWEQVERAHLSRVCKASLDAGVEERLVRIAGRQAALVTELLNSVVGRLDLTPHQRGRLPEAVADAVSSLVEDSQ